MMRESVLAHLNTNPSQAQPCFWRGVSDVSANAPAQHDSSLHLCLPKQVLLSNLPMRTYMKTQLLPKKVKKSLSLCVVALLTDTGQLKQYKRSHFRVEGNEHHCKTTSSCSSPEPPSGPGREAPAEQLSPWRTVIELQKSQPHTYRSEHSTDTDGATQV